MPAAKKLTEAELLEIEKMAEKGLTQVEIAKIKGMDVKTLRKYGLEAYERGAANVVMQLKEALIVTALTGDVQALKFGLKNLSDWTDSTKTEISGPGGTAININTNMSDEELDKAIALKLKQLKLKED